MNIKKQITEALKSNGINFKEVSVKQRKDEVVVTIHNLFTSKKKIESIVKPFESITRDVDGDILDCSTFVTVEKIPTFSSSCGKNQDIIEAIDKAINAPTNESIAVKVKFNDDLVWEDYFVMKDEKEDIEVFSNSETVPSEVSLDKTFIPVFGRDYLYEKISDAIFENILDCAWFTSKKTTEEPKNEAPQVANA